MNESDAPLCGRRHLWLEPTKLRCCLVLQRSTRGRTRIAMERRIQIDLERDRNSFSETQPRTCWVICTTVHTDERAPLSPTTVDPSRTADEGEDENERGDETSEPAQTENRSENEFQTEESAKELWASLPPACSSHASSLTPSDET